MCSLRTSLFHLMAFNDVCTHSLIRGPTPCAVWILVWLMIAANLSSVPGFTSTVAKLHQPAALSCEGKCSGSVKWTSRGAVVARCDQTSCSSEEGFLISHDQYMQGNLSLTITAADYRRRGWYTCQCDGRDVCDVSLRIQPVAVLKQIRPGDPFVMDVLIPERVEVMLTRSSDDDDDDDDDGAQSSASVPLCAVDGRRVQCDAEYEERVLPSCRLTLSAVKETDSGVYTVRDADNDEIIATYTLTLTGNDTDANNTLPEKGKRDSWNLRRIFEEELRGVTVGLSLGLSVFGAAWIAKGCVFIREKLRKCRRRDHDHSTLDMKSHPGESSKLCVSVDDKGSSVGSSV